MKKKHHSPSFDFLKYIGPGLLVAVGFIDPGNWASNLAAGSQFGYKLLWVVTFSTIILIFLQHNAAHLGIATGKCLSESATEHLKKPVSRFVLITAIGAAVATAMAEILGSAMALQMLFKLPLLIGTLLSASLVLWLLFSNSYRKLEKYIIGFVSLIGISFLVEMFFVKTNWNSAMVGWVNPVIPTGSMPMIMSILGAVVMPHNLFLHSEVIQSRQWNLSDEAIIEKQLKYEYLDTVSSMIVGWAINSAIVILATTTFYTHGKIVTDIAQAQVMLKPFLGNFAADIFAIAFLIAGISSSMTAGMAGGSIFAGIFKEPYDIHDNHSKLGVLITIIVAALIIFFITKPFMALVYSQMLLSVQLPITIFLQVYLTSSKKVMGKYANKSGDKIVLITIGAIVTILNVLLLKNI